jgi:hypothetical protein
MPLILAEGAGQRGNRGRLGAGKTMQRCPERGLQFSHRATGSPSRRPLSMVVSKCSPFTLHGPMTKASHAARRQCARSYRSAEITLSHGRLVAEEVAYDLNLACETLREPV